MPITPSSRAFAATFKAKQLKTNWKIKRSRKRKQLRFELKGTCECINQKWVCS